MSNVDQMARDYFPASTPPPPVSGLAIASLSLGALTILPMLLALLVRSGGILAALLYLAVVGVPAVLAIVFGWIAYGPTKRGELRGYRMAQWGVALGILALMMPYIAGLIAAAEQRPL